jgi:hypothetical protein
MMQKSTILRTALVAAIAIPTVVHPAELKPHDGVPRVPAAMTLSYDSAFHGYQPFGEARAGNWQAANAAVRERGGWRAYAREALPESPRPGNEAPAKPADPHAGHGAKR